MKQKCKRLFTLLLAVALLATGLPAIEAKAAEPLPTTINGLPVTWSSGDWTKEGNVITCIHPNGAKIDLSEDYQRHGPHVETPTREQWFYIDKLEVGTYKAEDGDNGLRPCGCTFTVSAPPPLSEPTVLNGLYVTWSFGWIKEGNIIRCMHPNGAKIDLSEDYQRHGPHLETPTGGQWFYIHELEVGTYKAEDGDNGLRPCGCTFTLSAIPPTPTPKPSTSKEEAPTEPLTPAEEIRAAEEEAFPLTTVETDKTGVTKEEVGLIPDKTYNLSAYATTRGFVSALEKIVKANPKEKTVSIFTGKAFTFNKGIVEAINKGGKEVVYYFNHEGHLYSITVPATVDAAKVLEKGGHAGPLYVGKVLGTTRLIK